MSKTPSNVEEKPAKPDRNIIWRGVKQPPVVEDVTAGERPVGSEDPWVDLEPPSKVYLPDFPMGIDLPDAATQRAGFFLKEAGRVIQDVAGYKAYREDKGKE